MFSLVNEREGAQTRSPVYTMGNKVNKVCYLDYNPLVSEPRARERRASPQMRARARGVFPLSARLSLRRGAIDWDRWWCMELGTTTVPGQP